MSYVTLTLDERQLRNGGMYVDMGTEQTPDGLRVTLFEEDIRAGTFVLSLIVRGQAVPYTWTFDGGDHRAVQFGGVQYGGTREQYDHSCVRHAEFAAVHGRVPGERKHMPREN